MLDMKGACMSKIPKPNTTSLRFSANGRARLERLAETLGLSFTETIARALTVLENGEKRREGKEKAAQARQEEGGKL